MNIWRRQFTIGILLAGLAGLTMQQSLSAVPEDSFFTHLHTEKAMANVTISPARVGPVALAIQLETIEELPLKAKAVSIRLTEMQTGRALQTIDAAPDGDDQWHASVSVPSAGNWMLALAIAISDSDKVEIAAPIIIK
jgi:copper transport protein